MERFKKLSFHSLVEEQGNWDTDYETNRRYQTNNGLHFYECGVVELWRSYDRVPDEREKLERSTNLEVYSSADVLPSGLVTSDGMKLPKAWLAEHCMLLFDWHANVIVSCSGSGHYMGNYQPRVWWPSPTAFPVSAGPIRVIIPDRAAEAAMFKEIYEQRWNEAQVLKELDSLPKLVSSMKNSDYGEVSDPKCKTDHVLRELASMTKGELIERHVRPRTGKKAEFPFLRPVKRT